jgi:uncharacterized membrane protein YccC
MSLSTSINKVISLRNLTILILLLLGIAISLSLYLSNPTQQNYAISALLLNSTIVLSFLIYFSNFSTYSLLTTLTILIGYNLTLLTMYLFIFIHYSFIDSYSVLI